MAALIACRADPVVIDDDDQGVADVGGDQGEDTTAPDTEGDTAQDIADDPGNDTAGDTGDPDVTPDTDAGLPVCVWDESNWDQCVWAP